MTPRPRIVDELGRELVRAAREAEARARGRCPRLLSRLPRSFVLGLLALLGLAAAAAAASLIIGRGEPIPAAAAADVPLELRPVAGSARLNGLDVPDPDGGPVWDVRTSRSRTGAICATVGQVLDGELGLLGLDRRFRALPAGAADTCSTPQRHGATLAGARAFRGGGNLSALTVVNGVAAPAVRRAVAIAGGRTVAMQLGAGHAFLAVFEGLPEQVRPRIVLTEASGRSTTLRFADSGEFIAADPAGGSPWELRYGHSTTGLRCVSSRRENGPDSPLRHPSAFPFPFPSSTPWRCGDPAAGVVAIARFVPGYDIDTSSSPWGLNPARTIAWGIAPAGARTVVLTGAGAPRRLTVDRARRGFLAVLDGRVDPRGLRVSADGRMLQPRLARGRQGQALAPTAVPAWRSVASVFSGSRGLSFSGTPRVVPGSVAISRRADDPTGGPPWLLRSWSAGLRGRISPGMQRGVVCFATGIERGGALVEPRAGGAYRTLGFEQGLCQSPSVLADRPGALTVRTYVADPDATEPRPVRVVVAGLLGDGTRSARLLGAGAPRALSLGRHGTFLVVLGPEHAGRPLRVRSVRRDGRVQTTRYADGPPGCRPTPGATARVADPDGQQPWMIGAGTSGPWPGMRKGAGGPCLYIGRLLGDRLAFVVEGETWLHYGLFGSSGGSGREVGPHRPLVFEVRGPGNFSAALPTGPASPAQVARRTLPGRSVVSGQVSRAVRSITLSTPRDVRTLRPSRGGTFIAVYDGAWYGGEVVATLHMRDGRVLTRRQAAAFPG